jgi:hypothetical protein
MLGSGDLVPINSRSRKVDEVITAGEGQVAPRSGLPDFRSFRIAPTVAQYAALLRPIRLFDKRARSAYSAAICRVANASRSD